MPRVFPVLSVLTSFALCAPAQQLQATPHLEFADASLALAYWTAIDVGDLDGDGRQDLVAIIDGLRPQLFRSDGRRLVNRTSTSIPPGSIIDLADLALGDVDGDGDLDLVVATSYLGQVRLLVNDGHAVFADFTSTHIPPMAPGATHLYTVTLFDADADGDLDLFAGLAQGDRLLQNDGTGHFVDATSGHLPPSSLDTYRVTVGDLDGDGAPDLVTRGYAATPRLTCLRNNGQGVFSAYAEPLLTAAEGTYGLTIADLNGDRRADVLTDGGRRLLFGSATGLIDVTSAHLPPHAAGSHAVADIDADLDLDVVGAQYLLVNDGSGHFTDATATRYQPTSTDRVLLAIGDFDGDRDVDAIGIDWWFLAPHSFRPSPPRVLGNQHRHLGSTTAPRRGQLFPVDLVAAPGYGTGSVAALPFLGAQPGSLPFPGLGCIGLDLQWSTLLPIVVVGPSPNGRASFALPIPNWPSLANVPFYLQALTIDGNLDLRLTNCLATRIL